MHTRRRYIDYDREMFSTFMSGDEPAAGMVKGSGNLIKAAYNLKGDLSSKRNDLGGDCSSAPHFSNTGPDGCTPGGWNGIMNGNLETLGNEAVPEPESVRGAAVRALPRGALTQGRCPSATGRLGDAVALRGAP